MSGGAKAQMKATEQRGKRAAAMADKPKKLTAAQKQKDIDSLTDAQYKRYSSAPKSMDHRAAMEHALSKPSAKPHPTGVVNTPRDMQKPAAKPAPKKSGVTTAHAVDIGGKRFFDVVADKHSVVFQSRGKHMLTVSKRPNGKFSPIVGNKMVEFDDLFAAARFGMKKQEQLAAKRKS